MEPHRVIAYRARAQAGYDCNFMVMYPARAPIKDSELDTMCDKAIADARKMHGDIQIVGRVGKMIMA